jgi:hypothetical protein
LPFCHFFSPGSFGRFAGGTEFASRGSEFLLEMHALGVFQTLVACSVAFFDEEFECFLPCNSHDGGVQGSHVNLGVALRQTLVHLHPEACFFPTLLKAAAVGLLLKVRPFSEQDFGDGVDAKFQFDESMPFPTCLASRTFFPQNGGGDKEAVDLVLSTPLSCS